MRYFENEPPIELTEMDLIEQAAEDGEAFVAVALLEGCTTDF